MFGCRFSNCGVAKLEDYKINRKIGLNRMLIEGNRGALTLQGIPLYSIQPSSHNIIKLFSDYFQFNFSFRRVQCLGAAFRKLLLWFGKQHVYIDDENVFGVGINYCI